MLILTSSTAQSSNTKLPSPSLSNQKNGAEGAWCLLPRVRRNLPGQLAPQPGPGSYSRDMDSAATTFSAAGRTNFYVVGVVAPATSTVLFGHRAPPAKKVRILQPYSLLYGGLMVVIMMTLLSSDKNII
jgi:hypothetical protein